MTQSDYHPPQLDPSCPILQQLRQVLQHLGYISPGLTPSFEDLNPVPAGVLASSPLNTVRLFFSQEPVDLQALRDAIQPLTLEELLETGFCRLDDEERIITNILLQPYNDLLFAIGQLSLDAPPEDLLMAISLSSLEVAHLVVPRHARNALDLGTGCGFLALLLSKNSDRVYAVDLNPTAVRFAKFNAGWNAISNITCLQGNLFEPVRHLRFDLIVSNPPFFLCPVPAFANRLFKYSGQEGDSFCIELARKASTFLEEDGYFHMMFSWLELANQDWKDKLTAAFSGLACDVWGLRTSQESPEDYVSELCRDIDQSEIDAFRKEGVRYFKQNNIAAVGTGLLTLRRCSTRSNHLWFDEAPDDRSDPYGSIVSTIFDIRVRFDSASDDALLQQKFTTAPDLVSIQKTSVQGNRWQTTASELGLESGLKYTFNDVDPFLVRIIPYLDGRDSLRQVLERLAYDEQLSVAEIITKNMPSLRELLHFGFLRPVLAAPPQS